MRNGNILSIRRRPKLSDITPQLRPAWPNPRMSRVRLSGYAPTTPSPADLVVRHQLGSIAVGIAAAMGASLKRFFAGRRSVVGLVLTCSLLRHLRRLNTKYLRQAPIRGTAAARKFGGCSQGDNARRLRYTRIGPCVCVLFRRAGSSRPKRVFRDETLTAEHPANIIGIPNLSEKPNRDSKGRACAGCPWADLCERGYCKKHYPTTRPIHER